MSCRRRPCQSGRGISSGRRERDHRGSLAVTSAAARRAFRFRRCIATTTGRSFTFSRCIAAAAGSRFFGTVAAAAAFPSSLGCFEDGRVEADEAGKFIIRRIAAGKLDGAVDEDEGQVFRAVVLEEIRNGLRLDEFQRRTGQIIAADVDAMLFERIQNGRYAQEFRVDRRAAETGRAAHCLFKDFHMFHHKRPPKKFIYLHLSMY